jgi:hypothetical protein
MSNNQQNIPNIYHFINLGPREFNMLHFLSLISTYQINKPDKIYLYCDHDQEDNFYWEILKDILTIEKVYNTEYHKGVYLESYQYRADTLRIEKLLQHGGVYMDLDVLSIRPINSFLLDAELVMGIESADDPNETDISKIGSITNAVILSRPNNLFLQTWYDQIASNLTDKPWAFHAVCLPKIILTEQKFDITIKPRKTFMPFDFRDTFIFEDNFYAKSKDYILAESHTMHMWETIWKDGWLNFDVDYFNTKNNLFVKYFGKYMDVLYKHIDKLEQILDNCMAKHNYEKLLHYSNMYIDLCKRYDQNYDVKILAYYNLGVIKTFA